MRTPTGVKEVIDVEVQDPEDLPPGVAPQGRRGHRIGGEGLVELLVLPVVVALVFLGYVWWRNTAHLDAIEASSLNWASVRAQTWQHIRLTLVSAVIVVAVAPYRWGSR